MQDLEVEMTMKSPIESEFYPCRLYQENSTAAPTPYQEDNEEIYVEEIQTKIAKCKSECVKTMPRVNTSDFPPRVQQPVSKSHTHFKGKQSASQRRKMRLEADYNLTRPRSNMRSNARGSPNYAQAYMPHPQAAAARGAQQRSPPPASPPFVIGIPTEIRPTELRQTRPRLIGMPPMMPPNMCNGPPKAAHMQGGPRVTPPGVVPQPQAARQIINDQAAYGYQPRHYFMNKYKVLPPVYANLAQEQCYAAPQYHPIYQAHYQSHNDIHQQSNNNYARFNAIQQQAQNNQQQIYANWSPNWSGSPQLAAAAAAAVAPQQQPYGNHQANQNRQQQQLQKQQQQQQQQQYQPYMNHNNLIIEQCGADQMNEQAAVNLAQHKKKSIINSIFTFPKFVFKGFK